jgi:predicted nucleic acid-binding protein
MLYFDTSFLAPLLLSEATSERITAVIGTLDREQFSTSHWTRVEFSSLLARAVRMGVVDSRTATQTDTRFEAMLIDAFFVILPAADDFNLAKQYLGRFDTGLRAGEAFHLAIARNHNAQAIYTLDKGFFSAGTKLGLPVSMGI